MESIEKFLQGRYGFDGLACGLVFLSLIINLVTYLVPVPALHRWNFLCFVPLVFCVLRMFSRSTEKRSRENERFLRIFASFFALFDRESKETEEEEDIGKRSVNESGGAGRDKYEDVRQRDRDENEDVRQKDRSRDSGRSTAGSSDTANRRGGRVDKKEQAQLFRFFKCPACSQRIRVPRGKGKVEITCPKCGNRFIKKT